LAALIAVAAVAGCQARVDDRLVVATTWTSAECAGIEADFDRWVLSRSSDPATARRPGIRWVRLSQTDDLEQFARKRRGVDVLLGWAAESYRSIDAAGLLEPLSADDTPHRSVIEWPADKNGFNPSHVSRMTPRFLEFARAELGRDAWTSGYERLLRLSGQGERESELKTGRASREGAAIAAGARRADAADQFMAFLAERRGAKPDDPAAATDPAADGLLADLLRATLFDSRDELRPAWGALKRENYPQELMRFMLESPPWPPASVAAIQARDRGRAMPMIETLAGQIAPEIRLRSWLLRSWLGPPRRVDGDLLAELSRAEGGRLAREPRFRAWLRAEWTAWARQRYRRIARKARSDIRLTDTEISLFIRHQAGEADAR
jgi:hypothetical protein